MSARRTRALEGYPSYPQRARIGPASSKEIVRQKKQEQPRTPSTTASGSQELASPVTKPPPSTAVSREGVACRRYVQQASAEFTRPRPRMRKSRPTEQRRLTQRDRLGKGRDAIVYELRLAQGSVVLKIPRHIIPDLPVPYVDYLVYKHRDIDQTEALRWMELNFAHECRTLTSLWDAVADTWLPQIGFKAHSLLPARRLLPRGVSISDSLKEDNFDRPLVIKASIDPLEAFLMPRAVCDGFNALVSHFSVDLYRSFVEDVLFQMTILEECGVVHGDLKLANILLVRYQDSYVFLLSDFWDGFTTDSTGHVKEIHSEHPLSRLFTWKFQSEKFGTRLYKDPCLLERLRACSGCFGRLVLPNCGAANMWSFGIIALIKMLPRDKVAGVKDNIKNDVLASRTMPAPQAIRLIRDLSTPYLGRKGACPAWLEVLQSVLFTSILTEDSSRITAADVGFWFYTHSVDSPAGSWEAGPPIIQSRFPGVRGR